MEALKGQQRNAAVAAAERVMVAVLEAIESGGALGTPSGVLFTALSGQGCTLPQYESLMGALAGCHAVEKDGDVYRLGVTGRDLQRGLKLKGQAAQPPGEEAAALG